MVVIGANGGAGRGTPEKRCRCVVNALVRARRRRFRTCRRCRTCRSAALSATAATPPSPPLPNVPIHFLVEDERLVGVVLAVGGCHVADLKVGRKTLFVVLSDVVDGCAWWGIGGDAVGVAVIWIRYCPPCECGRSSFPFASASTRRRRLMPLGWRVARNDHLGSQMISPTNSKLAVSKIISISTYLYALSSLPFAVYLF